MTQQAPLTQARFNMVEQQVRPWMVLDQRVLDTLTAIPRDQFVAAEYRQLAYADLRIPIGAGQRMMNPNVEGRMLQAVQIPQRARVLEIGTGSGFITACLAHLGKHVDSIEIDAELAARAQQRLTKHGVHNVALKVADATQSGGADQTYDAVVVTGAVAQVEPTLKAKLRVGGRLFVIVGLAEQPVMEARLLTRVSDSYWSEESLFETWIEPLINSLPEAGFEF